jgi:proteasome lid subunit RPN8/RPN11
MASVLPHGAEETKRVVFDADVLDEVRKAAAAAYPNEGCGALLGRRGAAPCVTATIPLSNAEKGAPRVRFAVSPRDFMNVEREADGRGLSLLGFWHSHPDHPARPSATDREFAWEGLLTLIVSVRQGEAREVGAFQIPGPDAPFDSIEIFESRRAGKVTTLAIETNQGGT